MKGLKFAHSEKPLSVLCLGAHSDDIEIGLGGALLNWINAYAKLDVHWCVASAAGARKEEAENSAAAFLAGARSTTIELREFKDGFFPHQNADLKNWFEDLKSRVSPDVIFTHRRDDAHQDHRELCQLTWNTFRDHVIVEYEIPKWDGDLGQPNFYVPIRAADLDRKIELLNRHFGTQRSKDWFDAETFRGLARLRGMECRAEERYAEAFVARKLSFGPNAF
ncbi:PIG-L deacetylase family protein [Hyphomicrobium sp. 99]|uniref:PIG-L deacetylase family protein n=1 Tax=Hyphomicrobium sp. 99 TaxID=1163419 RepID=UPI0005F76F50|nr:PIG-L deacetylase family protein [Hyphomicrobium sp. 99]